MLLLLVVVFQIAKGHGGTLLVTVDCVRGSFSREKLLRALFGAQTVEVVGLSRISLYAFRS